MPEWRLLEHHWSREIAFATERNEDSSSPNLPAVNGGLCWPGFNVCRCEVWSLGSSLVSQTYVRRRVGESICLSLKGKKVGVEVLRTRIDYRNISFYIRFKFYNREFFRDYQSLYR